MTEEPAQPVAGPLREFFSAFPDYILQSPAKVSMLQTAQNVAEIYNLSRSDLDEYAVPSHLKAP